MKITFFSLSIDMMNTLQFVANVLAKNLSKVFAQVLCLGYISHFAQIFTQRGHCLVLS